MAMQFKYQRYRGNLSRFRFDNTQYPGGSNTLPQPHSNRTESATSDFYYDYV